MTTKYVLRYAYTYGMDGYTPVEDDGRDHYLYKSVRRDPRHNRINWRITERIDQARTWATREGAEGYLADKFTYEQLAKDNGVASSFVVEEVTA